MKKLLIIILTLTLISCWEPARRVTIVTVNDATNIFKNCSIDYSEYPEPAQTEILILDSDSIEYSFASRTIKYFSVEFDEFNGIK